MDRSPRDKSKRRGPGRLDLSRGSALFRLEEHHLLFEDEHLVFVAKPAGLPSQTTLDPSRHHLAKALEEFLVARDGQAYVGQHHRLDLGTTGVMVFTKTKAANPGIAEQFKKHTAQKTYLALSVNRALEKGRSWRVKNFLAEDKEQKGHVHSVRSGGSPAETAFKVLSVSPAAALIEARPSTGRRHQIRVHLAEDERAIYGDDTYASEKIARGAPRLMLHAMKLELEHPITGAKLAIECPPPEDFVSLAESLGIHF